MAMDLVFAIRVFGGMYVHRKTKKDDQTHN